MATPVWRWRVPKPVVSLLASMDLSGKYVLPLATSAGNCRVFFKDFGRFTGLATLIETSFSAIGDEATAELEKKIEHWISLL
jgi:hypothetical protein